MFKLISMKTIGLTAVSLALLVGTLATPAFAKSDTAYRNKGFRSTNRSVYGLVMRHHRLANRWFKGGTL